MVPVWNSACANTMPFRRRIDTRAEARTNRFIGTSFHFYYQGDVRAVRSLRVLIHPSGRRELGANTVLALPDRTTLL
jgi:hypothetical protein